MSQPISYATHFKYGAYHSPLANFISPVHVMVGRGNGVQGLGAGGTKRHRKILRDNIQGITRSTIRGLARRAGVIRMSGLMQLQQLLGCVMQVIFFISSRSSKGAETKTRFLRTAAYPRAC
ncbi:hypothetical protein JG688_00014897 [Phytophthora aleatoria]|uniref:Histone H4 n=1 Tax=Phytophthora aleatoria TaxID=2496075 RepID=A0A8J5I735_9STRA|nr:hypothetical protein JG688_00014897 [Phytophthora aleatoria]